MLAQWTGQSCYDKIAHWHDLQGDSWALASLRELWCSACQLEATSQSYECVSDYVSTVSPWYFDHISIEPGAHLTTKMAIARVSVFGHDSILGHKKHQKTVASSLWWFCAALAVKMQGDRENGVFFGFKTARDLETKERPWLHHDCDGFRQAPATPCFLLCISFPLILFVVSWIWCNRSSCCCIDLETTRRAMCAATAAGELSRRAVLQQHHHYVRLISNLYAIQFLEPPWKLRPYSGSTSFVHRDISWHFWFQGRWLKHLCVSGMRCHLPSAHAAWGEQCPVAISAS